MPQRQPADAITEISPYKYEGIKDKNIRPHEQCEMKEDAHLVKPRVWPPPRVGNMGNDPYLSLRCELCGANLIVYEGHATGEIGGVEVIIPEIQPAKRGPGRPRKDDSG